jgi:tRNA(Leu) C34 or U34 (ribose-2'-O)-methylase TrmL
VRAKNEIPRETCQSQTRGFVGRICKASSMYCLSTLERYAITLCTHLHTHLHTDIPTHTIEQVKEHELTAYLVRMRAAGYLVVGLEQTAGSVKLQDAQFPVDGKVVVLLGREKLGVPVELLQLVDMCIEIPQLGIVRSLNVHVSGAILMWEYTKQQLATQAAAASAVML